MKLSEISSSSFPSISICSRNLGHFDLICREACISLYQLSLKCCSTQWPASCIINCSFARPFGAAVHSGLLRASSTVLLQGHLLHLLRRYCKLQKLSYKSSQEPLS